MKKEEKYIMEKIKVLSLNFSELAFTLYFYDIESTYYVEIEPSSLIQDDKFIDFESDVLVDFGTSFPELNLVFIRPGEFGDLGVPLFSSSHHRFYGQNYSEIESLLLEDIFSLMNNQLLHFDLSNLFTHDLGNLRGVFESQYFTIVGVENYKKFNNRMNLIDVQSYSCNDVICEVNNNVVDPIAA